MTAYADATEAETEQRRMQTQRVNQKQVGGKWGCKADKTGWVTWSGGSVRRRRRSFGGGGGGWGGAAHHGLSLEHTSNSYVTLMERQPL